jgi:putative membrane protein insertion efficiency factor
VTRTQSGASAFAVRVLLGAIRVYQILLSPLMPSSCRFHPTCSRYAYEAIEVHGVRRGSWLALRRLLRCHPFTPGGVDAVPGREVSASAQVARL